MNENDQQNYSFNSKPRVKEKSVLLQKLVNLQYFINAFYEEQKQVPWKSLYGPGPSAQTNLSLIHLWYVFILSFIPVCSLMAGLGFVQPYLASDSTLCDWTSHPKSCENIIVLFITYRIGFSISIFFLFTSLLLLKTNKKHSSNETSTLHNGFWIEKILVVLILSCVAFAFPPSIFDRVWLYFILIGDFVITCLQVFLLCDLVKDVHDYVASYIFKTKTKILLWRSMLLFMEIIGPTCAIFTFSALTVYTVVTKNNCIFSIIITIISITIVLLFVMYILCVRRCELLRSIYVVAYILFLVYKATVYRTVCDPNVATPQIVSTDLKTTIPILILYITLIYALIRKDQITHFYYFYWVICCQQTEIGRNIPKINETENNEPIRKQSDISHDIPYNKVNQNETLLDLSFQRTSSESVKQKQDDPSRESKTSKQLKVCYNETFIHFVFFLISLKSTSLVSGYFCLHQQFDGLIIIKPTISVISLQVTSVTACILYFWFLYCKYSKDIDPLWTTELVRSLFELLLNIFYMIFIKIPVCFRNNTLSKYIYTIFYVCSFTLSCIVLTPSFRKHFENNSIFCENIAPLGSCISQDPSYVGLYRVMVTVGLFFFVLATLTINLKVTKTCRNDIQNGCWLLKAILLIAFFTLFVNLSSKLSRVWLYLSLVATFVFTFVQLICLLDCVNIMQASWSNSTRLAPTTLYYSSTSLTTFLYLISTAAFVCFYIYFAQNFNCKVTRLFISINLVLCISASLISIHPAVKTGGLLRSAIVTSFCMYLTWTALNYNPNEKCNPLAHSIQMVESKPSRDAVSIIDTFFLVLALIYYTIRIDEIIPTIKQLSPCYLILCRCCKNTDRKKRKNTEFVTDPLTTMNEKFDDKGNVDLIERWLTNCQQQEQSLGDGNIYGQKLLFGLPNNNLDQVSNQAKSMTSNSSELADKNKPYSYWWFHLVYFIATSYSFVLLTHWIQPIPGSAFQITVHWAIMCVRMVGSCCFVLLYIWTMVNPLLAHLYHYNRI